MGAENSVQLSLFDLYAFRAANKRKEELYLKKYQPVWMVQKGDVIRYYARSNASVGYFGHLKKIAGYNSYDIITHTKIGKNYFLSKQEANASALSYIEGNRKNIILAEDLHPVTTEAYRYVRECDGRMMVTFYSVLEDGNLYMKEFLTFEHILDCKGSDKVREKYIREFREQRQFKFCTVQRFDYAPAYSNMYRCKPGYDWMYAESGYGGCL